MFSLRDKVKYKTTSQRPKTRTAKEENISHSFNEPMP
jgi:hypothetical protein